MRNLLLLSMMAVLITACDKEDTVAPSISLSSGIAVSFHIINRDTGEDLFLSSDTYDVEDIIVYVNQIGDVPWEDSIRYERRGDSTILTLVHGTLGSDSSAYLLRLTPTDYDTVSVYTKIIESSEDWNEEVFATPPPGKLDEVHIYYNGKFIMGEQDMAENEDLRIKIRFGEIINTFYKDVRKEN